MSDWIGPLGELQKHGDLLARLSLEEQASLDGSMQRLWGLYVDQLLKVDVASYRVKEMYGGSGEDLSTDGVRDRLRELRDAAADAVMLLDRYRELET